MGFESDVAGGGGYGSSGFGVEGGGGYGGYGGAYGGGSFADAPSTDTGIDWGGLAHRTLNALVARGIPYASPLALGAQLGVAKARGTSNQDLENMAGRGLTSFMSGGLSELTSMIGRGAQWGAKALGAQGGPQPGMGEQLGSGGFGGLSTTPQAQASRQVALAPPPQLQRVSRPSVPLPDPARAAKMAKAVSRAQRVGTLPAPAPTALRVAGMPPLPTPPVYIPPPEEKGNQ